MVRDQRSYRWYQTFVGDTPLPPGVKVEDLGKCEHAIRVKGADSRTYEVGLVRNEAGTGWSCRYDYYAGGGGLMEKISAKSARGQDCLRLIHEYSAVKAMRRAQKQGHRCTLTRTATGMPQKLTIYR